MLRNYLQGNFLNSLQSKKFAPKYSILFIVENILEQWNVFKKTNHVTA